MNLSVEQLMERAIRALETGQPGLATLYMRRALVLLAVDRTVALVPVASSFLDALVRAGEALGQSVVSLVDAVLDALSTTTPSDFALVAGP